MEWIIRNRPPVHSPRTPRPAKPIGQFGRCPAAPLVHVEGLDVDVRIRVDDDNDREIARLAMEMAERRSRPSTAALPNANGKEG